MELLITRFQPSIEDKLIEQEQLRKLHIALDTLADFIMFAVLMNVTLKRK